MRAIVIREPGDESVLQMGEAPSPALGPADLRIRVRTTAVNRADLLQRQGLYPPPPGVSPILGMECAGEVLEVGPEAHGFRPGQRVMALLPGGGYAEEAVVHHGSALPVPETMSDEEAGAFPEVFLTAFSNLFMPGLGALAPGEAALVHGGGGGVGTAAILLCREAGNSCFVTAGSDEQCRQRMALGATAAIDSRRGPAASPHRPRPAARRGGRGASPDAVERALREDRAARQLDERRAGMAGETDYLARGLEVAAKLWGARVGGQELPAQKLAPEF